MDKHISVKRVVFTSLFVDLLDIVVNLIVTLVTGSVVMMAELVQGLSDFIASALLLVGLNRSKNESYFWSLISALVMLLVASSLSFYFGFKRFLEPEEINNILVAYLALGISAVSNGYAFLLSAKRILRKDNDFKKLITEFKTSSLIMTKNTFVLDLMGMSAALVGLVALVLYQFFGDTRFDGLGAMGIGVVLGLLSLNLVLDIKRMPKEEIIEDGL